VQIKTFETIPENQHNGFGTISLVPTPGIMDSKRHARPPVLQVNCRQPHYSNVVAVDLYCELVRVTASGSFSQPSNLRLTRWLPTLCPMATAYGMNEVGVAQKPEPGFDIFFSGWANDDPVPLEGWQLDHRRLHVTSILRESE